MAEDKNQGEIISDEAGSGLLTKVALVSLLGVLTVSLLKKRKTSLLKKRQKEKQNGIVLGGIAMGTVQIHVDPIKHPYLTFLGNVIQLLKQSQIEKR